MQVTVKLLDDSARRHLAAMLKLAHNPAAILNVGARALTNALKTHFRQMHQSHPNKLGGRRTGWWLEVGRSLSAPQLTRGLTGRAAGVRVAITHPHFWIRYKGGTITPKRRKFLTIPLRPDAYGRTAATFEASLGRTLRVVKARGRLFLAANADPGGAGRGRKLGTTRAKGKGKKAAPPPSRRGALRFYYLLAKRAKIPPMPSALPSDSTLSASVLPPMEAAYARQLAANRGQ